MALYISQRQLANSVAELGTTHPFFGMAFLALKSAGIPVGSTQDIVFSKVMEDILRRHFRPYDTHTGYYTPFQTSDNADRWLAPRYGSTSLQRIVADTFADALLHEKRTSQWGWKTGYVDVLQGHLGRKRIPAFHLAVWLYFRKAWPQSVKPADLVHQLKKDYSITGEELEKLFNASPSACPDWLSAGAVAEHELLEITGPPPGVAPAQGAALSSLELREIGPATRFLYEPADRLNVLTGDNTLGKTFILEAVWWALTGEWLDDPISPRQSAAKSAPEIAFSTTTGRGQQASVKCTYDWDNRAWRRRGLQAALPGLVVYARYDSSFAVWDPARARSPGIGSRSSRAERASVFMSRRELWDGLSETTATGGVRYLCNGLFRDWVAWQRARGKYSDCYRALVACLNCLSPRPNELLAPGEPGAQAFDAREVPTIRMPYGDVPLFLASAGVQRIASLAYVLTWAWYQHTANSEAIRRPPERRLILLMDEVEAHLHPKWQRTVVPSLVNVMAVLSEHVLPQLHLATHSPLVMASLEPIYNSDTDALFHLDWLGNDVQLQRCEFVKHGEADQWLMSPVFGLATPRSLEAEEAIKDAKLLQQEQTPRAAEVRGVHDRLVKYLAQDDSFWPRWLFFAQKHGIDR